MIKSVDESGVNIFSARCGDELDLLDTIRQYPEKLAYPLTPLPCSNGRKVQVYAIPMEKKKEILDEMYPFTPVPSLTDIYYDIHEDKTFTIGDFLVIRCNGKNYIVSPYYAHSGGTVIDWVSLNDMSEDSKQ